MRVAVYNEHWSTLGGGEQLAAGFANALAQDHDVDLLVMEPFDAVVASERLGADLTDLSQRQVLGRSAYLLEASADYDVLVNTSFASQLPSAARVSIYYVHFPVPHEEPGLPRRLALDLLGPLVGLGRGWIEDRCGTYVREFPAYGRWTDGDARIDFYAPEGTETTVGLSLDARFTPQDRTMTATVTVDGRQVYRGPVGRERVRVRTRIRGRGAADPIEVRVLSDTFVPRADMGIDDDRTLGLVVSRVFVGVPVIHVPSRLVPRWMKVDRFHPDFLRTYDAIAVNSPYTGDWVQRLWDRSSEVVAPPVRLRRGGAKGPIVLSVGRFFANDSGHSKKQLELARAFRALVEQHGVTGWELHLVGGCTDLDRGYVDAIRRESVGLPIQLHVNARGQDVDELYARASIFWHAGGINENPELHPERFEHFGISVVEAMSAGCPPMVFHRGGPAAIVEHGVSGLHFSSIDELATQTASLVQDPDRLAKLAATAENAAQEYDAEHFARRARAFVDRVAAGTVA